MSINKLIITIAIFFSGTAFGQEFSVLPLFSSEVFAPYIQIPFRVSNPGNIPVSKYSATILNNTNNHCQVMQDPFIPNNFILRCNASVTVTLKFNIHTDKAHTVEYGPISIKNLEDLVIVDSRNPQLEQTISMGRALFSSNCISCHQPSAMRDRSAQIIKTMINAQPEMNLPVLKSLTAKQIDDIAVYLRNLGASP